jgi:YD repeat-containing protein
MKPIIAIFLFFVFLNSSVLAQKTSEKPLEVSGVYPSFAAFNSPPDRTKPNAECGIGQLVNWAGKLWYTSYTSHDLFEGTDKLHYIDKDYNRHEYEKSVGGTSSCRMIHRESEQLIIASYFIDRNGNIRTVPRKELPGRLTAVSRHINDPANKVLFLTQEGAVYEVDVHSLKVTMLFKKPAVGWHAKGAYTSQGVFVVSNNGEEAAPSPWWNVEYSDPWGKYKREQEVKSLYLTAQPNGPEDWGSLCEWDGKTWKLIKRGQYLDVTGPGGLTGARTNDEQIWSYGWDKRSLLLSVRDKGAWKHYRMLKPTYTFENRNGFQYRMATH